MLFRITASSADLGILAILLLLFSATQGVPVGAEQTSFTGPEQSSERNQSESAIVNPDGGYPTVRVRDLPFVSNLLNPCPSDPPSDRVGTTVAEDKRSEFAVEFYRTISESSARYRQDAQQMLDQDIIHGCSTVNIPNLENIPTLAQLENMDASDALVAIYASILRHTAHAYFIRFQHQTYANISCSSVIDNEAIVSRKAGEMAVKQKFLACIIRMGVTAMGYPHAYNDITQEILNEQLSDLRECSRRVVRDCQVVRSIIHLLDVVHEYTTKEVDYES